MRKCISYLLSFTIILSAVTYIYGVDSGKDNLYYGFEKISVDYQKSIDSNIIIYEHKKSGGQVVYIQNNDPNQVFAIGFKTPVHDNTGVNHIIEHTVFTGSQKYNTKDVFFEMNKRSPNIYMNASTWADMTIYPFSTRNNKDYDHLLDVYLDAVFFPNLQRHQYGFAQEGWHYSIDKEGQIQINGVVYNEMKGASVIPQRVLAMINRKVMFPDTMYVYSSGGEPSDICQLTYEDFKKTHMEYYIPANSCAYIYGNANIESILKKLDNYYSLFEKKDAQNILQRQMAFKNKKYYTGYYPAISENDNCLMSINYAVGEMGDTKLQVSMEILMNILVQYENSPLKKALNKENISKMLYVDIDSTISQPMYSIIVADVNKDNVDKVDMLVQETLQKVVLKGLDNDIIKMAINDYEIAKLQNSSNINKGIQMAYDVIHNWGHDAKVMSALEKDNIIEQIKKEGDSKYFQNLIKKYIIDNNHVSKVVLEPDINYITKQQEKEKQDLKIKESTMTVEEANSIISNKEELEKWQQDENNIFCLPQLKLEDINTCFQIPELMIKEGNNNKKLYYITDTKDLVYVDLFFETSYIPQESLNELFLLAHLISGQENDEISLYTGGITCDAIAIANKEEYNLYQPKLKLSMYMKEENIDKAFEILEKTTRNIDVWDSAWLLTQIHKIRLQYENYFNSKPLNIMNIAINSSQTGASRYEYEKLIPFYQYICKIEKEYNKYKDPIMNKLSVINSSVFNKNNLILGTTLEKNSIKKLEKSYKRYYKRLNDKVYSKASYTFDSKYKRQGLTIASDVQYIVWGGNYIQAGGKHSGALYVLNNILNTDYMLQNLRVKNGAYGAGLTFNPYGNINIYTSQDPQLQNSLTIIREIPRYVAQFDAPPDLMINYKIGALAKFEQSIGLNDHPKAIGETLYEYHISGINSDDIKEIRNQIINTTSSDIRALSPILKKVIEERRYSIAGSKSRLLTNNKQFDIIQSFSNIYNSY